MAEHASSSRLEKHRRLLLAAGHHPVDWILGRPIGSTAMAQMPNPVDTLALWGPLMGSTFLLRSVDAFNEVVVKHAGLYDARRTLFYGTRRGRVGY